jgi:NAD(P)-dependent dehydrogenase (short-subunit alcohol dehydrogenase family)
MTQTRNIFVTGSSRGIGKAILAALRGHNAIGHSSRGGGGLLAADLDQPGAAEALWNQALEHSGGRIDTLVNNAGVFEAAPIDMAHGDWVTAWERTMRVNLTASAELCRLAVTHFQTVGGIPLGRVATADEVAETVRWLALDAPPSSTGAVIDVNGASYVR